MSDCSLTEDRMLEAAKAKNQRVRYPKPNQLFLDIDSEDDFDLFNEQLHVLKQHLTVSGVEVTVSKSGLPHRHVVVTLGRKVSKLERIALQTMLGSDRVHELLSWCALGKGNKKPSVLFENEPADGQVGGTDEAWTQRVAEVSRILGLISRD